MINFRDGSEITTFILSSWTAEKVSKRFRNVLRIMGAATKSSPRHSKTKKKFKIFVVKDLQKLTALQFFILHITFPVCKIKKAKIWVMFLLRFDAKYCAKSSNFSASSIVMLTGSSILLTICAVTIAHE